MHASPLSLTAGANVVLLNLFLRFPIESILDVRLDLFFPVP